MWKEFVLNDSKIERKIIYISYKESWKFLLVINFRIGKSARTEKRLNSKVYFRRYSSEVNAKRNSNWKKMPMAYVQWSSCLSDLPGFTQQH